MTEQKGKSYKTNRTTEAKTRRSKRNKRWQNISNQITSRINIQTNNTSDMQI